MSPTSPRSFTSFPLGPTPTVGSRPRQHTRQPPPPEEFPLPPATYDLGYAQGKGTSKQVLLELADGSSFSGFSFGAVKSVSGELVFQTGLFSLSFGNGR
jgi:carbamoyl-phosphate synthase/aspartate carbamoyltransferase